MTETAPKLFGIAATFATEPQVTQAVVAARREGFGRIDVYTPVPILGLAEAAGVRRGVLGPVSIAVAAAGALGFFGMSVYATMVGYPFIIGNRPAFSWPYYVIPSISFGMLAGAVAATLGMLFLCRLPRLNHPAFNIDGFDRVSADRYVMTIEALDERFDAEAVAAFLQALRPGPVSIQRVPR